jgi:NADPH:quinone reductase-like Zn-dependent oxidoreductase
VVGVQKQNLTPRLWSVDVIMKAICIHRTGGPGVLRLEDAKEPLPSAGELLIEIHFASVNPVDAKIRQGKFKMFKAKLPAIIGRDVAGVVRSSGRGSNQHGKNPFRVGDPVFGMLDYDRGAYAQFAVASPRELARTPKNLGELEAGSIGVAALTAWQGLFDHGRLRRGQRVLIHGAAGGVGHFAVQFAKIHGATVIATAGKKDLKWVAGLGADHVIDFKNQRFEDETGDIDLVFDLIGGDTQARSWKVLKDSGGALVSTLEEPSRAQARMRKARALRMVVAANSRQMGTIARLIASGRVRVKIAKVFPLRDARRAHKLLENGHVRGKVMLKVA